MVSFSQKGTKWRDIELPHVKSMEQLARGDSLEIYCVPQSISKSVSQPPVQISFFPPPYHYFWDSEIAEALSKCGNIGWGHFFQHKLIFSAKKLVLSIGRSTWMTMDDNVCRRL